MMTLMAVIASQCLEDRTFANRTVSVTSLVQLLKSFQDPVEVLARPRPHVRVGCHRFNRAGRLLGIRRTRRRVRLPAPDPVVGPRPEANLTRAASASGSSRAEMSRRGVLRRHRSGRRHRPGSARHGGGATRGRFSLCRRRSAPVITLALDGRYRSVGVVGSRDSWAPSSHTEGGPDDN